MGRQTNTILYTIITDTSNQSYKKEDTKMSSTSLSNNTHQLGSEKEAVVPSESSVMVDGEVAPQKNERKKSKKSKKSKKLSSTTVESVTNSDLEESDVEGSSTVS